MIQQKDLARFKRFAKSSGIGQAVNLTKGQAIKADVAAMMASFSACMDDDADYVAGGVQSLTNAITSLSGELTDAHGKLDAWNGYIALAMKPEELNTRGHGRGNLSTVRVDSQRYACALPAANLEQVRANRAGELRETG